MSEETNETLGHDEAMDITEVEATHSHAEHQTKRTYGSMSRSEFEAKLTEFFTKHQKSKLRFVPRIVNQFGDNAEEVLEHLHNRYVLGMPSSKGGGKKKGGKKKLAAGTGHGSGHGHDAHSDSHSHEIEGGEVKPKSKKKMIIIIVILVVVLGGGGAAAFMFKDKLFGGGHGAEHGTEHNAAAGHDEKAAHGAAEKAKEEPAKPAVDSASTGGADTTAAAVPAQPAAAGAEHGAGEHGGGH